MDNLNNNNFPRINRNQLISDSNLTMAGSISGDIRNPKDIDYKVYNLNSSNALMGGGAHYLESRLHYANEDVRLAPILGYCLRFDKSNQAAYIQTTIPSTEYSNYDIFIKGEGTVDILYPDHSGTNIAIKQKYSITDSNYFFLSYIAFRNKTTKKIEHLFECEESTGTVLYDAVTGDTATLESVVSISVLRTNRNCKEWIIDENINLVNRVDVPPVWGNQMAFQTSTYPLNGVNSRSYCFTLEFTEDWASKSTFTPTTLIGDLGSVGSNLYGNGITFQNYYIHFDCGKGTSTPLQFKTTLMNTLFGEGNSSIATRNICRKGIYKCVYTLNIGDTSSTLKFYVNGVLKYTDTSTTITTSTFKTNTTTLAMFFARRTRGGSPDTPPVGCYNVYVFNNDISSDSSIYSIQDYQNDVIPEYDMNGLLFASGNIQIARYSNLRGSKLYWCDRSINNNSMYCNASHPYSKSKCYGTWLDGVGFNLTNGVYIPRKVELS